MYKIARGIFEAKNVGSHHVEATRKWKSVRVCAHKEIERERERVKGREWCVRERERERVCVRNRECV